MKKSLVFFSEESIFSGLIKSGVAEVVDTLALSLVDQYEVNVICRAGDLTLAKKTTDFLEYEESLTGQFLSVKYHVILKNWPQSAFDKLNELQCNIIHAFDQPCLIDKLAYIPDITIYTIDDIKQIKGEENYLRKFTYTTFPSQNYSYECLRDNICSDFGNTRKAPIGISDDFFKPETGLLIPHSYSKHNLFGKEICKRRLADKIGCNPTSPIFLFMARIVKNKGIDSIIEAVPKMKELGINLLIVGKGEQQYEEILRTLNEQGEIYFFDNRFSPFSMLSVLSGADFFLSPSIYEPGGLMPMTASLYGTIPIVSRTGGLLDNFNDSNGIVINTDLLPSIEQALLLYKDKEALEKKRQNCMSQKFGWTYRKNNFIELYEGRA